VHVNNSMNTKNVQSKMREIVQTWARCAASFKTDADTILVLLENLKRQQDTLKCVERTLDLHARPHLVSPLLLHGLDLPCKLKSKVLLDMESTANLIKSYQRGMGDVFHALQFAASDAGRLLEQPAVKDVAGVAPVLLETILDIKRLQWLYDHDYHRRRVLLSALHILHSDAGARVGHEQELSEGWFVPPSALDAAIQQWQPADGSIFSQEDSLLLNNIIANNFDRSQQGQGQGQEQSSGE
jgi:hypothetical protein